MVRPPIGETWLIKQLLDLGAQTILVPMVEFGRSGSRAGAGHALSAAWRSRHRRSLGAGVGFQSGEGLSADCGRRSLPSRPGGKRAGIAAVADIAAVDGVDGVFFGPADLAADMGRLGNPGAAVVVEAVEAGMKVVMAAGKPVGTSTSDKALARRYLKAGATFVAVGSDVGLLASSADSLRHQFADGFEPAASS